MTPLPIKRSGTPGSLCQAQDFSLRYLKKTKTHHRRRVQMEVSTHRPFRYRLETFSRIPGVHLYSRRKPISLVTSC
jgi:hypothetical protein